ncbi:hypothetical protein [Cytobacillus kochii]
MFDPIAFDNMKVVLEGHIYDFDLTGEMKIIDRNDWMNLAKFSRRYDITFTDTTVTSTLSAKITLQANLQQITAELQPAHPFTNEIGAHLSITFILQKQGKNKLESAYEQVVKQWGNRRTVQQRLIKVENEWTQEIVVNFDRLITEDQLEDLLDLIDHTQQTLIVLDQY